MNRKLILIFLLPILSFLLTSCNETRGIDTSELEAQTVGAKIKRSGTTFPSGTPEERQLALADAENRLKSGGGLLGKKGLSLGEINKSEKTTATIGLPINPYLWKGSLETIDFMPLASVDPFAGIIITDWYANQGAPNERCKINIFIKGYEMKTDNLKVNSFCQSLSNGQWVDIKNNIDNDAKLENAILNKAKKIRLSQS
ncbi:MAG: DUF3576 domain-containing protein [Pelagibacteraceae bacterium]|jgi:hypothetical protein|nr:DUF3576 domain-containing protein [Pelagibacteraceae bacterium]